MVDDAFGHWLAGFLDGEGCFIIGRQRKQAHRRWTYVCRVEIALRADDVAILREIQARTGLGRIHEKRGADDPRRPNPFARWQMSRQDECMELARLLDVFPLRAKKAQDYAVWRRGVQALHARDWSALDRAFHDLRAVRAYDAGLAPLEVIDGAARLFDAPPDWLLEGRG